MNRGTFFVTVWMIGVILVLAGCGLTTATEQGEETGESPFVPVQEYTGQGYAFDNGEQADRFAEQHRKEIVAQVDQFFEENYHLEVTTHNLVGSEHAVIAFVESKNKLHFHTSVNVGVDLSKNKLTGDVWAIDGVVEGAITSGLYAMAYEEEFNRLNEFTQSVSNEYPVTGMHQEAINNTWSFGHVTPYYYIGTTDVDTSKIYQFFMNDQSISSQDLRAILQKSAFDPGKLNISLTFYMEENRALPDQEIAKKITEQVKQLKGVAPGSYAVFVRSNEVLKRTGSAKSDTGTSHAKDEIIKDIQD